MSNQIKRNTKAKSFPGPYSEEEIKLLSELWPVASTDELLKAFPKRSHIGLLQKAAVLGLVSEIPRMRKGDVSILLNNTPVSFYWLGFLLADGHFTKSGQLTISLMDVDRNHLDKLALYLKTTIKYPYHREQPYITEKNQPLHNGKIIMNEERLRRVIRIAVQDSIRVPQIQKLLGLISTNKTYNPPDSSVLRNLDIISLTSLFIGFFDGDGGSVFDTKNQIKSAGIENHKSWIGIYELFKEYNLIYDIKIHPEKNTISSSISRDQFRNLVRFSIENNLPVMDRKWHLSDFNFESNKCKSHLALNFKRNIIYYQNNSNGDQ
jgi:hypothetical protein